MGVQATMTIGRKSAASAAIKASGAAGYPATGEVSIVALPAVGEEGQLADIYRTVRIIIDFVRDTKQFNNAGSEAFVTTLDAGKAGIISRSIATEVVTGDIGIMVNGAVKDQGNILTTENAHLQLLDWMRENGRLAS